MKKVFGILMILMVLLISCADKRKEVVANYEQQIDGIKTDLSLKVTSLKEIRISTAKDSIPLLDSLIKVEAEKALRYWKLELLSDSLDLRLAEIKLENDIIENRDNWRYGPEVVKLGKNIIEHQKNSIGLIKTSIYICLNTIEKIERNDFKNINDELTRLDIMSKKFKTNQDSVLFHKVSCRYTIKNPFLNNVKQELTKTYAFAPDNSKILYELK